MELMELTESQLMKSQLKTDSLEMNSNGLLHLRALMVILLTKLPLLAVLSGQKPNGLPH